MQAGETLLAIDAQRAKRALSRWRAATRAPWAEVESLRALVPPRRAEVDAARARLASARPGDEVAEVDLLDRANLLRIAGSLEEQGTIAVEEIDRRRFSRDRAVAGLAAARAVALEAEASLADAAAQLARLVTAAGDDGPDIQAAAERAREAERSLDDAGAEFALLTVEAPADARILRVNVRAGEFAPASVLEEPLLVLGRLGPTRLRVEIDEVDIPRCAPSARA